MITGRETTMSAYIDNYKNEAISFSTLHYKKVDPSGHGLVIHNDVGIWDKFKDTFKENVITVTLTPEEKLKYYCNPKAFSMKLYGTTELWFLILQLNEMYSAVEFQIDTVKVYDQSIMLLISEMLNVDKPFIDINEAEIADSTIT